MATALDTIQTRGKKKSRSEPGLRNDVDGGYCVRQLARECSDELERRDVGSVQRLGSSRSCCSVPLSTCFPRMGHEQKFKFVDQAGVN